MCVDSACASCVEDAKSHIDDATAHIEAVTVYTDAATAHTAIVTAHMAPGTIKHPFEPTATALEKMAKPFINRKRVYPLEST